MLKKEGTKPLAPFIQQKNKDLLLERLSSKHDPKKNQVTISPVSEFVISDVHGSVGPFAEEKPMEKKPFPMQSCAKKLLIPRFATQSLSTATVVPSTAVCKATTAFASALPMLKAFVTAEALCQS